jgi:hypothetical protein
MAFPMVDIIKKWLPGPSAEMVSKKFEEHGLAQAIDLAMADDSDIVDLFVDDAHLCGPILLARNEAMTYKNGWS